MRSYSRLGALVTKESARQYEEGQTDARNYECLPMGIGDIRAMLTRTARKASNGCVVILRPSREEELLSDHVFTIFDRTLTVTGYEQLVTGAIVLIALGAWAVQRFRRKRTVVLHRSAVSDQLLHDLSRIADALEFIANRPADQVIAAANRRTEESRGNPLSIFGHERPQG